MAEKVDDMIIRFLDERDVSMLSKRQYRSNLLKFYNYCRDNALEMHELRNVHAVKYKQYLQQKGFTPLTVANLMVSLRLFFRWMQHNNLHQDITSGVRIEKHYNTFRKKSLGIDQSRAFLDTFDRTNQKGARDYAIACLMLFNGLREIEVARMNVEDIGDEFDQPSVTLQRKGRKQKDMTIPLSRRAMDAIEQYLLTREDAFQEYSPMFTSRSNNSINKRITTHYISVMIKQHMAMAGINGKMYTAHSLRHTTASLLIANGFTEYMVKTFMGHTNFATTQIYTRQREREMIFKNNPSKYLDLNL